LKSALVDYQLISLFISGIVAIMNKKLSYHKQVAHPSTASVYPPTLYYSI